MVLQNSSGTIFSPVDNFGSCDQLLQKAYWTLEIMQKSLLKVYALKWMHRGVNERVFALLIVDRRKWMRILR